MTPRAIASMKTNNSRLTSAGNPQQPERPPEPEFVRAVGSLDVVEDEARIASFVNQLPAFAWIKDLEGRYVYANGALQNLEMRQGGWVGKTDVELWPKEIAEAYRANDLQVIADGKPLETLEPFENEGRGHILAVSKFPIRDKSGAVILVGGASFDVTERASAEERLREYERVVEGVEEMITVVDRNYRYLLANRAFLDHRAQKRENVVGHFIWEVLGRDRFEQVIKDKLDECFASNVVTYQSRNDFPEIGERDLFVSYFPIEGPRGIDRVACVLQDITERNRAEEAITTSRNQLAEAQQLAHVGSWDWDLQTNQRGWSRELYRIFGLNPDVPAPHPNSPLLELIHPEDRERFRQTLEGAISTGEPCEITHRIIRADGVERIIHSRGNVIVDESGKAVRMFGTAQDVTEQRRTADALRDAERKYREIFQNAGEGIFRSTPEGRFIVANPALAAIFGFETPEELIRECSDISRQLYVDPSRRDEFMQSLEASGFVRGFEARVFRKDRTTFWISLNARTVRDVHGRTLYYEGTAQDITERKRAELASAAFGTLARRLSGASTNFDAARIIAETARLLFGWDACNLDLYDEKRNLVHPLLDVDTINGKHVDVTPLIAASHPTARGRRVLARGPELILREQPIKFDADSVPFGDKKRPAASIMSVPIKHRNEIVGLLSIQSYEVSAYDEASLNGLVALAEHCGEAVNRIRTEESFRESKERYRELFENSKDAIYVHDLDGLYVSVNGAAEELSGYPRDEILGQHFSTFICPHDLDKVQEKLFRKLSFPVETAYEAEIICKDGSRKPIEISSRMIYRDGHVVGIQGTARDITERKRAQAALQTYARRLIDAAEAERQNIARELHDEIGQVLTAVRLGLQRIQQSCDTSNCLPYVDEGIEVVDEALSRVRELSFELRPSLLDDLGLAAALRWYVSRYTERTGIKAEVSGASEVRRIPQEVEIACFRIIQEALTNTARHSHATEATVYIEKTKRELRVTVTDNGAGFQTERLLDGLAASALGLRGMQERALAVRGHVEINSTIGKGTQVIINVPLKKVSSNGQAN